MVRAIEMKNLPLALPHQRQEKSVSCLLITLLSARLRMEQGVYYCIGRNMYQTLQEHKDASRELEKIRLKAEFGYAQKLYLFPKGIFQIN